MQIKVVHKLRMYSMTLLYTFNSTSLEVAGCERPEGYVFQAYFTVSKVIAAFQIVYCSSLTMPFSVLVAKGCAMRQCVTAAPVGLHSSEHLSPLKMANAPIPPSTLA